MKKIFVLLSVFLPFATFAVDGGPADFPLVCTNAFVQWRNSLPAGQRLVNDCVAIDEKRRTISFFAESTGLAKGYETEFLVLGKLSDRAYESLYVAHANPSDVAKAIAEFGIPLGTPANFVKALAVSKGERFTVTVTPFENADKKEIPIETLIEFPRENSDINELFKKGFPYIGTAGIDTVMPAAIIACYNEKKSLFGMPFSAEKGAVYGSFRAGADFKQGLPVIITLHHRQLPNGAPRVESVSFKISEMASDELTCLLKWLKSLAESERDVFLSVGWNPDVSLKTVKAMAKVLMDVEKAKGFMLDVPADGDLPLRAFLPDDAWRKRDTRPYQPWEVEILSTNNVTELKLTHLIEDWNVQGLNPKLTPVSVTVKDAGQLVEAMKKIDTRDGKIDTLFIFASKNTKMKTLADIYNSVKTCPYVWIFADE